MTDFFAGDARTNRERMLAGDLYLGGDDPDSMRIAQRAVQLADAYHRAAVADEAAARPLLTGRRGPRVPASPSVTTRSSGQVQSSPAISRPTSWPSAARLGW